ncbi:MAG: TIGR01212 family radical SAM protein [Gammaproteobacteria bacterium]|nr:MAG: TIGR01212 family radical SAM protein [Gammaproteobacteria bacterium]
MPLSDYVNTFGQYMLHRHGERIHKIAINAGFTCPNRDGSKGIGGCTFCNNASFSPNHQLSPIPDQLHNGRQVIPKRTGARRYLAYFQAYTNTYAETEALARQYEQALAEKDVIGLSVGTRPDCVPEEVLDLLCRYRDQGHEVWLELGLQSAHDHTLHRVNRGHGFAEYETAVKAARSRGIPVCTHLILGLPGETAEDIDNSFDRVIETGVNGLKLHPLHIVKGTQLAREWKRGEYIPLLLNDYVDMVSNLIRRTPKDIVYHRITATAQDNILLAPHWCSKKWLVLNSIEDELRRRNAHQGDQVYSGTHLLLKQVVN